MNIGVWLNFIFEGNIPEKISNIPYIAVHLLNEHCATSELTALFYV